MNEKLWKCASTSVWGLCVGWTNSHRSPFSCTVHSWEGGCVSCGSCGVSWDGPGHSSSSPRHLGQKYYTDYHIIKWLERNFTNQNQSVLILAHIQSTEHFPEQSTCHTHSRITMLNAVRMQMWADYKTKKLIRSLCLSDFNFNFSHTTCSVCKDKRIERWRSSFIPHVTLISTWHW